MQTVMEPVFEIVYLIYVITLGGLTFRMAKGKIQFQLFGVMAVLLGCGDAFHLVPRIYALLTDGLASHTVSLGFGKLVTSITMTLFYTFLYHVWKYRYGKEKTPALTAVIYTLAALRIGLCLLPQNEWLSADPPLSWGIYRNIPFALLGIIVIVLYFREARQSHDKAFRFMWLAVTLSFMFYIPVVLFTDAIPALGMLMLPKTCAYMWIVWMGYMDAKTKSKEKIK